MPPNIQMFLNFIGALVISIGGTTVIILALAKWFGDFLSRRLFDNYKNKHERELIELTSMYSSKLEETKNELEKAKASFLRYSEKQFDLYNDLWKILLHTKKQADLLWEKATPNQIPSFSEQINLTRDAVSDNMLFLEEEHFNDLDNIIKEFENFVFGKYKLINLRDTKRRKIEDMIDVGDVKQAISINQSTKNKYDALIIKIGKSFRNQIKGI